MDSRTYTHTNILAHLYVKFPLASPCICARLLAFRAAISHTVNVCDKVKCNFGRVLASRLYLARDRSFWSVVSLFGSIDETQKDRGRCYCKTFHSGLGISNTCCMHVLGNIKVWMEFKLMFLDVLRLVIATSYFEKGCVMCEGRMVDSASWNSFLSSMWFQGLHINRASSQYYPEKLTCLLKYLCGSNLP